MTTSNSSSTTPPKDGATFAAIASLADHLIAAWPESDLTARWMSQYLAERMHQLEELHGPERADAEREIAGLVAELWRHRAGVLPKDPLVEVAGLARAVARLDPQRPPWGYYSPFTRSSAPGSAPEGDVALLDLAVQLDRAAGDVVGVLVRRVAERAQRASSAWLQAVRESEVDALAWLDDLLSSRPVSGLAGLEDDALFARVDAALQSLRPPHAVRTRRRQRRYEEESAAEETWSGEQDDAEL